MKKRTKSKDGWKFLLGTPIAALLLWIFGKRTSSSDASHKNPIQAQPANAQTGTQDRGISADDFSFLEANAGKDGDVDSDLYEYDGELDPDLYEGEGDLDPDWYEDKGTSDFGSYEGDSASDSDWYGGDGGLDSDWNESGGSPYSDWQDACGDSPDGHNPFEDS